MVLCTWLKRRRRRLRFNFRLIEEPEELQCSICAMLFRDPVVTTRGFTYERSALLAYWRSPSCVHGPRDPRSGNSLVDDVLTPNWQIREVVERFLRDNPNYVPRGWPDRTLPPPARAATMEASQELPGGFAVGDVVVSLVDRQLEGVEVLQRGDVGKVLGSAEGPTPGLRCSFLSLGTRNMQPPEITLHSLPGGYKVGDAVVSLIDHAAGGGECILRGDLGRVVSQASVDVKSRLKVNFPKFKGLDVYPEQISPEVLPGGYRIDDIVVSLIDHFGVGDIQLSRGEKGVVAGQATTDPRRRLKVDFPRMRGLDILPFQLAPQVLPGGYVIGDLVISRIDHESLGAQLRQGDIGRVVGNSERACTRLKVDFPNMRGLAILPSQVRAAATS